MIAVREETKTLKKDYDKTEDDLKALQSVGQIIGEVLRQLDAERFIVKASSGPRYVVGCRNKIDKEKLVQGTRVSLDIRVVPAPLERRHHRQKWRPKQEPDGSRSYMHSPSEPKAG